MTMSESESEGKVLCGELFCTDEKKKEREIERTERSC